MRILILNFDYPGVLSWLYHENPDLATASYGTQLRARVDNLFGVADFYSKNLTALGHEAWDIHVNNGHLQTAWAREHGLSPKYLPGPGLKGVLGKLRHISRSPLFTPLKPWLRPISGRLNGLHGMLEMLRAQIDYYRPDVILNQAVQWIPIECLTAHKPGVRLIVGQLASALSEDVRLGGYDLMISSLPNFVERFRNQGLKSELVNLAFEPSILARLPQKPPSIGVSFVGTLSTDHLERLDVLEKIADNLDLRVWGRVDWKLPATSALRQSHRGPAWGRDMYSILQQSQITLNFHIGIAEEYANNLRLFEATGVGTMLLTDYKKNIHEIFEPGREVVVYRTPEECVDLARFYLDHEKERETIARAGQQRTLRDHTYRLRMQQLSALFERYLGSKAARAAGHP